MNTNKKTVQKLVWFLQQQFHWHLDVHWERNKCKLVRLVVKIEGQHKATPLVKSYSRLEPGLDKTLGKQNPDLEDKLEIQGGG